LCYFTFLATGFIIDCWITTRLTHISNHSQTAKSNTNILLVIIAIYPFFSNFILTFVFFLGIMGILWLIDWIRHKQSNWIFFFSIAMMTAIYLVKNYLLIYTMFFSSSFTSQRSETNLGHKDFPDTLDLFM